VPRKLALLPHVGLANAVHADVFDSVLAFVHQFALKPTHVLGVLASQFCFVVHRHLGGEH